MRSGYGLGFLTRADVVGDQKLGWLAICPGHGAGTHPQPTILRLDKILKLSCFFVVLRFILRADRTERRIYKEMEAEERARLGLPPKSDS